MNGHIQFRIVNFCYIWQNDDDDDNDDGFPKKKLEAIGQYE